MADATPITVAYGDGIGPEIMEATLKIIRETKVPLQIETIQVGEEVYKRGNSTGIGQDAWDAIHRNKIILKAPITTPQGGGVKSLNVTIRRTLGLYANIRPSVSYHPLVHTLHPELNVVIVRENEEDLYIGTEYRQTENVCQSLKLISHTGSERIIRYAFDYAVRNGRKKVTCFSKDNIMKMTDGLFHKVFNEVAKEYPEVQSDHFIIDIGSAKLANKPSMFDVIVTLNLYGDVISDIASEISGSVGLAGSANIGNGYAMFEAIHGSAPDIAGQDIANPSGLLHGAIMMLVHIGHPEAASDIHNAWLCAIEDGIHTADIYNEELSAEKVGTQAFADAVIKRIGQHPRTMPTVEYKKVENPHKSPETVSLGMQTRELVGVDVYVQWVGDDIASLADKVSPLTNSPLPLHIVTCKGLKVWPGKDISSHGDHWCLRFTDGKSKVTQQDIIELLGKLTEADVDIIQTQHLYNFDGERGYTLAQGE